MGTDQSTGEWDGSVPRSVDVRVLGLAIGLSAVAASVNVPFGGGALAIVAFGILSGGAILAHLHGQCRLRRITAGLATRWDDGGRVATVEHASGWTRTTWVVHTAAGPVTISGLALTPFSKVSIEWDGTSDVLGATTAEQRLDALATEWFQEVADGPARPTA
ncbi:hypothetical protein [Halovivax cerinus]|uniref:Integral membrane protein n=1 Tax=Halovivax cerinus TaxID=1487865 RepID=A0ABD5NK47_9EURY|nr:hypothetical protein [Halovivax cerinus]